VHGEAGWAGEGDFQRSNRRAKRCLRAEGRVEKIEEKVNSLKLRRKGKVFLNGRGSNKAQTSLSGSTGRGNWAMEKRRAHG